MKKTAPSLVFCIAMDLVGYASYALPVIGEFTDAIWAPVSAFIFFKTFGGWKGILGGAFNFLEEVFPLTDIIPSFTIAWLLQRSRQLKPGQGLRLSR